MKIKQIVNTLFNSNTFIIYKQKTAILIDCGDVVPILDFIHENNLSIGGVFITHAHFDHIYGINDLMQQIGEVPVFVSKHNGKDIISDPRKNFSRYHETPMTVSTDICHEFDDESSVDIEDITIRPVYTPGHTVDSTSYIVGTSLFTGDAYIPGVKVVTKLKGANKEQAENSMVHLKNIQKDNNYSLYPGHGDIIISNTDIQI